MAVHIITREADKFAVLVPEVFVKPGGLCELRRADGGEVIGVAADTHVLPTLASQPTF